MKNFMDAIKSRRAGITSAQGISSRMSQAQTGKSSGPQSGPQMSNMAAQRAAQAGQAGMAQLDLAQTSAQQQLDFQKGIQQEQLAAGVDSQQQQLIQQQKNQQTQQTIQEQRNSAQSEMATEAMLTREQNQAKEMENAYSNILNKLATERGIVEQDMFSWAAQERSKLGAEKYNSFLEQTAHSMAMADQKYVDAQRRIGQKRDLQDSLNFRTEATHIAFGNDFEILGQYFDQQSLINADSREFNDMIKRMDFDAALELAEQAAKEESYKQILLGATELAKVDYDKLGEAWGS